MKKAVYTLLGFFFLNVNLFAQGGIAASPMKLEFTTAPGNAQQQIILLSNPGSNILEITANLNDWYRDSSGSISTATAGSLESSCAAWVKILPATNFILQPGEKKEITISFTPPANSGSRVCNSMVFFSQMNPQRRKTKDGISIDMAVRIGVQIYYTPPGLTIRNINIKDFKDLPSPDTTASRLLQLTLENAGQLMADGKVTFELVNLDMAGKQLFRNMLSIRCPEQ